MNKKISTYHITALAFAIALNYIGGQIALLFHLPIYLDSIGTFFIAAVCGPVYGMIPNTLSGILMWAIAGDVYSLFYAPVGIVLGLLTGIFWKIKEKKNWNLFLVALCVTLPTSLLSAGITAGLFGGITSSGSTVFVQLLAKTPLGLTLSCFIVQFITDYIDRIIGLFIATILISRIPDRLISKVKIR